MKQKGPNVKQKEVKCECVIREKYENPPIIFRTYHFALPLLVISRTSIVFCHKPGYKSVELTLSSLERYSFAKKKAPR